jgi:glycosyltransferase involved in cell wall biosynthesis
MPTLEYVVVTPVRNEAACLPQTIQSMAAQSLVPKQWIIVDDGSQDATGEIAAEAARCHQWITVVRRPDRGFRRSGGGVMEAFEDGYAALTCDTWQFIVKLDGDLVFDREYFASCLARFVDEPQLGIAGGTILVPDGKQVDSPFDPPFHVRGATKIYRRSCWQQIAPLVQAPGWDTIDEVRANMHGWRTKTFPDVTLVQQRPTGSADGAWRNWYKNGVANYVTGYHPLFMVAKCARRAFRRPHLAAIALFAGFCSGYVKRLPTAGDRAAIQYLRRQQLLRLASKPSIYGAAGRVTADAS